MRDFEKKWQSNKKQLYGLLIWLVKDIDLADDLLQDVYIRASEKIETYRGGDFRAWLAAIAKNMAFAYMRRSYTRAETLLDPDLAGIPQNDVGTESHLSAMLVRKAVDDLSPTLRDALLLKHYGGLNYTEIAERLNCPTGTAKRRVWTAIRQLRSALGSLVEGTSMKCSDINLLDYAYGTLSEEHRRMVGSHLATCEGCRAQLDDIRSVITSLDAARDQLVVVDISDVQKDGSLTTYSSFKITNTIDEPINSYSVDSIKYHHFQNVFSDGEEVPFSISDSADCKYNTYNVQLRCPLAPGESATNLIIRTTPEGLGATMDIGYGNRIVVPDNSGTDASDVLLVQMVRLPEGAKFIGSVPSVDEVRTEHKTTLIWRRLMKAKENKERLVVVYSIG